MLFAKSSIALTLQEEIGIEEDPIDINEDPLANI